MMDVTMTCISLFVVLILGGLTYYVRKLTRALKEYESIAADRLRYIRILIDIVYNYKHDPEHMVTHLCDEMAIKKMLSYHIVEQDYDKIFPSELKCRTNDKLLYLLHDRGFTARELCVIFGLNNLNSVYVKCHRLNKKLIDKKEVDLQKAEMQ